MVIFACYLIDLEVSTVADIAATYPLRDDHLSGIWTERLLGFEDWYLAPKITSLVIDIKRQTPFGTACALLSVTTLLG
jgi:hypothetical protein